MENFWNYLLSAGEGESDVHNALDLIQKFEESSPRNFDYLDQAISSLSKINLKGNKKWLWALANALLAYCYYRKGLYGDSFSAIRKVVEIKITTFTSKKQEIQDLKERSVNLQDQIYIELLKFLKSEKEELEENIGHLNSTNAELDQEVKQLKSENAELDQEVKQLKSKNAELEEEVKQLKSKNAELEEKLRQSPDGTINKTLLIVMCVLSSIGIIISLFCLFFK